MPHKSKAICIFSMIMIISFTFNCLAGSLDPDNPPGSTMKTLQEIKPACPINTLPGDANAMYVISSPGAYYLTENIQGVSGKRGITVTADNVTIDLNGFSMTGVPDSKEGIFFDTGTAGAVVKNGVIRSWGLTGLDGSNLKSGYFTQIISESNNGYGFNLGDNCTVIKCTARDNTQAGIKANDNYLIESCLARHNTGGAGFILFSGGMISGCVAEQNGYEGIRADYETIIKNCSLSYNRWGIVVKAGCYVFHNNCAINTELGIRCGGGATLTDAQNRIDSNNVMMGTWYTGKGIVVESTDNIIIRNTVQAATPYEIAEHNAFGPIVNVKQAGDFSSLTSNPWANFVF